MVKKNLLSMKKYLFLVALSFSFNFSVAQHAQAFYDVAFHSPSSFQLDGMLSEEVWSKISPIESGFHFPWDNIPVPKTQMKAFYSEQYFYFSFSSYDVSITYEPTFETEPQQVSKDRVEIFFAEKRIDQIKADYTLPHYYGIEVDPLGHVHDYMGTFYRKVDSEWNMPNLKIASTHTHNGYFIEGRIPLETLRQLGINIQPHATILVGVFRGDCNQTPKGFDMKWMSWAHPDSPFPDFHIPSAFGLFRFLGK